MGCPAEFRSAGAIWALIVGEVPGSSAVTTTIRRHGIGMNTVRKPSAAALLLALTPFVAMCFSVALWDRVDPMILGIPFNLFWLICWVVLSSVCMWAAYRIEASRNKQDSGAP
jgi:hypothetical protein